MTEIDIEGDLVEEVLHALPDDDEGSDQQEKAGPTSQTKPDPEATKTAPRTGKSKYRRPEEFTDHPWAEAINDLVNEMDPKESRLPHRAMLGESYVATLVQTLGDEIHPAWIAGGSTIIIGGIIGYRIWSEGGPSEPTGDNEGGLGLAARLS